MERDFVLSLSPSESLNAGAAFKAYKIITVLCQTLQAAILSRKADTPRGATPVRLAKSTTGPGQRGAKLRGSATERASQRSSESWRHQG